jgi:hypothetical protein
MGDFVFGRVRQFFRRKKKLDGAGAMDGINPGRIERGDRIEALYIHARKKASSRHIAPPGIKA